MHHGITWPAFLRTKLGWRLSLAVLFLVSTTVAASLTWIRAPLPNIHDEFSYLLATDTLLAGRLSNPTPAAAPAMHSFHVILEPSYASKYPLGNSLWLAMGYVLGGHPIIGLWLAAGFCAPIIAWMLAGVVHRTWAFVGGLLVALHPWMHVHWSHTYVSGWPTLAASCLVLGAVLRLRRQPIPRYGLLWGLGIGGLALCRPFEGLVFTLASGCWLMMAWRRRYPEKTAGRFALGVLTGDPCIKVLIPAAIPVVFALGLTAWQNHAITGSALRMAYRVHEQQYGVAPLFVFGQPKTPALPAESLPNVVNNYHNGWSLQSFSSRQGLQGWFVGLQQSLVVLASFSGIVLVGGALLGVWMVRPLRITYGVIGGLAFQLLASATVCWIFPHYLVPAVAWLLLLAVLGLQQLMRHTPGRRGAVWSIVVGLQAGLMGIAIFDMAHAQAPAWTQKRQRILEQLQKTPGDDVVLVAYTPQHNVHQEWVYNAAFPDAAPVIWLHDQAGTAGRAKLQREIVDFYSTRRNIWLLNPDIDERPRLLSSP